MHALQRLCPAAVNCLQDSSRCTVCRTATVVHYKTPAAYLARAARHLCMRMCALARRLDRCQHQISCIAVAPAAAAAAATAGSSSSGVGGWWWCGWVVRHGSRVRGGVCAQRSAGRLICLRSITCGAVHCSMKGRSNRAGRAGRSAGQPYYESAVLAKAVRAAVLERTLQETTTAAAVAALCCAATPPHQHCTMPVT